MKIESVVKINLQGEYEVLYMGSSRGEARQVYKENMPKKDEYMALFQQSGYALLVQCQKLAVKHTLSIKKPRKMSSLLRSQERKRFPRNRKCLTLHLSKQRII